MKKALQLTEQRQKVRQEFTALIDETLSAKILQFAGSWIQRPMRRTAPAPWYVGTMALTVVAILPQTIIAM